jgi:nucleoside-diphosphate-sugar epimerase
VSDAVLVTGAGGFVGSAIVRALVARLSEGAIVLPDGRRVRRVVAALHPMQGASRLEELSTPSPRWGPLKVDLRDPEAGETLVRSVRPVAIIHAALDPAVFLARSRSEAEQIAANPLRGLLKGLTGVEGVRFVHVGSAWVLPGGSALG